jgi:phosphatidylinositol-3-phosphatase
MENHGLGDILGSSSAPYMNQLASTYGLALNYTAVNHPSLPNYLALVSGQEFYSWSAGDCGPSPSCSAGAAPNIVDSLESRGLSWKAYMENYPSGCGSQCSPGGCSLGDSGLYAARHNPFVYFDNIANSTARCNRIVPANSTDNSNLDGALLSDLSSPSTSSNLMWLTPNLCNDMHDCSVSTGDTYLSEVVPKILDSNLFTHQKAALFITFDEGNAGYPNDYVYSVWAGRTVKASFESKLPYSHFSLLSTIEHVWHLRPLTTNDSTASPMTEFFQTSHHHGHNSDFESRDDHGTGHDRENQDRDR